MSTVPQAHETVPLEGALRFVVPHCMYKYGEAIDCAFEIRNGAGLTNVHVARAAHSPFFDFAVQDPGSEVPGMFKVYELNVPDNSDIGRLRILYRTMRLGRTSRQIQQVLRTQRDSRLSIPEDYEIQELYAIAAAYADVAQS